jgi:hypothetical protein
VTIEGLIMIKLHVTFLKPDSDTARQACLARPAQLLERDLRLGLEFDLLGSPCLLQPEQARAAAPALRILLGIAVDRVPCTELNTEQSRHFPLGNAFGESPGQ